MFCENCGKKLPDGAKFCGFCGAQQKGTSIPVTTPVQPDYQEVHWEDEHKLDPVQPPVSTAIPEDNQNRGGLPLSEEEEANAIDRRKKPGVPVKFISIVAVVLVVAAAVAFGVSMLDALHAGSGGNTGNLIWMDHDTYSYINNYNKSENRIEIAELRNSSSAYGNLTGYAAVSQDGKYLYFLNRIEESSDYGTLYRAELKKMKKGSSKNDSYIEKIDSNVVIGSIVPLSGPTVMYQTWESGTSGRRLRIYNGSENQTLAKKVVSVQQTEDSAIVYTVEMEDSSQCDIYVVATNDLNNPVKIASGAYLTAVQDVEHILYTKSNDDDTSSIYVGGMHQESVKIASNCTNVIYNTYPTTGGFFYIVEDSSSKLSKLVDYPNYDADRRVQEPNSSDFMHEVQKQNYWGEYYTDTEVDYDAYYAAHDEYEKAQLRMSVLSMLDSGENEGILFRIFYYSGSGEPQEICANVLTQYPVVADDAESIAVCYYKVDFEADQISMDTLISQMSADGYTDETSAVSTLQSLLCKKAYEHPYYTIISAGKMNSGELAGPEWGQVPMSDMAFYDNGKQLALLSIDYKSNSYDTYSAAVSSSGISNVTKLNLHDPSVLGTWNGNLIYACDNGNGDGNSDLYLYLKGESKLLAENHDAYVSVVMEDGSMYLASDYQYDYGYSLIHVRKDGQAEKISDDVTSWAILSNGNVLVITDSNLRLIHGNDKTTIAQDVSAFWTPDRIASKSSVSYLLW